MIIGKVIGNVWATRKDEKLNGFKFLVIRSSSEAGEDKGHSFVAVDSVGAGIGDSVIVTKGSPSRAIFDNKSIPIDAVVVGIIDSLEVDEQFLK